MKYRVTDSPTAQEKDFVYQELLKYNLERIEDKNPTELCIFLEDESGTITDGLMGSTHGYWLKVDYLWVSEKLRGQGIGSKLLQQAEATAVERGCKYSFLNTFSFQAPTYYPKLGYEEQFILNNFPLTSQKHYFTKTLSSDIKKN